MSGIARHTPTLTGNRAVRLINADTALLPDLSDAIASLVDEQTWLEVGDSVEDILAEAWLVLSDYYDMNLVGAVSYFLVALPVGWLPLDGNARTKDDYPELHANLPSHLKTSTHFTLPDVSSRFIEETTTLANVGNLAGASSYSLTVAQLAAHTHTEIPPVLTVQAETPTTPIPTAGIGAPTATGATGSGEAIDNRPEFVNLLMGIYAGRP